MPHPNMQRESALEQLKAIISHSITSHLGEKAEFHLAVTFCHVVVESDKVFAELPMGACILND